MCEDLYTKTRTTAIFLIIFNMVLMVLGIVWYLNVKDSNPPKHLAPTTWTTKPPTIMVALMQDQSRSKTTRSKTTRRKTARKTWRKNKSKGGGQFPMKVFAIALIVTAALGLVAALLLLHGVLNRNNSLVGVYFYYGFVAFLLYVVFGITLYVQKEYLFGTLAVLIAAATFPMLLVIGNFQTMLKQEARRMKNSP